jgi:thiamine-monophosphate kinase
MTEDLLISRYIAPIAGDLTDDAAYFRGLVITTDTLIENVHFHYDDPADLIARKALRVNLSDLAAKGATPLAFTLNLALPSPFNEAWVARFFEGLKQDIDTYNVKLIGGDTTTAPCVMISITAFGETSRIVHRNGAKTGDIIAVTGTIGDAAIGLATRSMRYLLPEPRVEIAPLIRAHANASMDISDGLVGDLMKLCKASNKGAIVDTTKIPCHHADFEKAVTGGDDYEILFTCSPEVILHFKGIATVIGTINETQDVVFLDKNNQPLVFKQNSYQHK